MKLTTTKTDKELIEKWKPVLEYTDGYVPPLEQKNYALAARWIESCDEEYRPELLNDPQIVKKHVPCVRTIIAKWVKEDICENDISAVMTQYPFGVAPLEAKEPALIWAYDGLYIHNVKCAAFRAMNEHLKTNK